MVLKKYLEGNLQHEISVLEKKECEIVNVKLHIKKLANKNKLNLKQEKEKRKIIGEQKLL